jgi:hypothetical protein
VMALFFVRAFGLRVRHLVPRMDEAKWLLGRVR